MRDFTRTGRGLVVSFQARTALDFLVSLSIGDGADYDLLPEDRTWLAETRGALGDELRGHLDDCSSVDTLGVFQAMATIVVERDLRDAADVVAGMESAGPHGVAMALFEEVLPGPEGAALLERALAGDEPALAAVTENMESPHREEATTFLRDPRPALDRARRIAARWLPAFQGIEARIRRYQEADLQGRKGNGAVPPVTLIEQVTGGVRYLPDGPVRKVFLAPSYFARPFNYIYQGTDWRLFCYPIADAVLQTDTATPPAAMVRLFRVLGDPTRMRVLKLLGDRDWYLTELATQLELSKPTMKHHLAQLRAAGLVTVTEQGTLTYYSLRRERLDEAGSELRRFLG